MDALYRILDYIASLRLDKRKPDSEDLHVKALLYEKVERLPIVFSYPDQSICGFDLLANREIYKSDAAMLYNELVSAWNTSIVAKGYLGDDLCLSIRPNWGTVLVASLLGYEPEQRDDQTPWIKRDDRHISLRQVCETDRDVLGFPWIQKVIQTYGFYHGMIEKYPELVETLTITLPDLQGPFDTLEQVMGSDLLVLMALDPEAVLEALAVVAQLQIDCMNVFKPYCTERLHGFSHQHGMLIRGNVLIRNDSVVMVSPRMYREIVAPSDGFVLAHAGGGGLHSCGKIDHAIEHMLNIENMLCFDFGQSYMNDVDSAYSLAKEKKIPLIRVQPTKSELISGSITSRFPTGVSLMYHAQSLQEASNLFYSYLEATH